jgi:hypothetical protein
VFQIKRPCARPPTEHKASSKGCLVSKKVRAVLVARFNNRSHTYSQAVPLDHRLAVSLIVEKELDKRGPSRLKGSKNWAASCAGTGTGTGASWVAIEVDSLALERPSTKRPRQATLSFEVRGWVGREVALPNSIGTMDMVIGESL